MLRCSASHLLCRRCCRGITILELLVVSAIIAVLVALVLPAVQAARESARRVQCTNRLKQIGVALHGYHGLISTLPPGWRDDLSSNSAFGWGNGLLPFLEQQPLFDMINFNEKVNHPDHNALLRMKLEAFRCPSDIGPWQFPLRDHDVPATILIPLPLANFTGVFGTLDPDAATQPGNGPFIRNKAVRFAEFEAGIGHTFLVGERSSNHLAATWFGFLYQGQEAQSRVAGFVQHPPGSDIADESEFSSRHAGGAYFLWGDGRVSFLTESTNRDLYRSYGTLSAD